MYSPLKLKTIISVQARNISLVLITSLSLMACQTANLLMDWPADVPERQLFVDGYYAKRGISSASNKELNNHLGWIIKFYNGTVIYPQGWNIISERYLATVEGNETRQVLEQRIHLLGIKIANEWAQANNIRLINNKAMLVWGNGLRSAAELMEHERYIGLVERDVDLLLSEDITSKDINFERYFPPTTNDDDNFDDF